MSFVDVIQPFVIGGISGITATSIIQPMDMIKVRIQIKSEEISKTKSGGSVSPFVIFKETLASGGVKVFYKGLDSAITRQIFYTTTRLGVYKTIFNKLKARKGAELNFGEKAFCSLSAGFIGAYVGNPADLALVRMQNDTVLPPEQRRNYKNVVDAFTRIVREEGLAALWKGSVPTVMRAMSLNFGMLAPYDEAKERLKKAFNTTQDTKVIRLGSSAIAGFLASFFSLPFDNAKTKMQKMSKLPDGTYPYKNILDTMMKTVKNESVAGLWVGFPTYYFRIAPHAMITLLVQDFVTDKVKRYRARH